MNFIIFSSADVIGGENVAVESLGPGFGDFEVGSHPVKYVARDSSGNKAVCDITVEVQGEMMNEEARLNYMATRFAGAHATAN